MKKILLPALAGAGTLVCVALGVSLASFGASAAEGWAKRPAAANKAERNDNASLRRLFEALNRVNVTVQLDFDNKTPYCRNPKNKAKLNPFVDAAVITLCGNTSDLNNTMLHEVAHVVQRCANDKRGIKALGWRADQYTLHATQFAAQGQYTGKQFAIEAEAQSFAETTSLPGAAKTVETRCK